MPIQPIDLQTLFAQLSNIGKEQAVAKDSSIIAQSIQGSELAKTKEHEDNSVNQAKELADGPGLIKDEKKKKRESKGEGDTDKEENKKEKEFFKDPYLGKHIDLQG